MPSAEIETLLAEAAVGVGQLVLEAEKAVLVGGEGVEEHAGAVEHGAVEVVADHEIFGVEVKSTGRLLPQTQLFD